MAQQGDDALFDAIRLGLETGQVRLHVNYRKARRVAGFREALARETSPRAVRYRDWFMPVSLSTLLLWFAVSQYYGFDDERVRVLGVPMSLSFFTFAGVLLALILFFNSYIKPIQGPPTHRAVLQTDGLFQALWQRGALALMTRHGSDRLCQSPRDDWRQFVQRVLPTPQ